jgi:hypothetical protein
MLVIALARPYPGLPVLIDLHQSLVAQTDAQQQPGYVLTPVGFCKDFALPLRLCRSVGEFVCRTRSAK